MERLYKKIKDRVPFELIKRTKKLTESSCEADREEDRPKKRSKKKKRREDKKLSDSQIDGLFTVDSPKISRTKNLKSKDDTDSDTGNEIEKSNTGKNSPEIPAPTAAPEIPVQSGSPGIPVISPVNSSTIDKSLMKSLNGKSIFRTGFPCTVFPPFR